MDAHVLGLYQLVQKLRIMSTVLKTSKNCDRLIMGLQPFVKSGFYKVKKAAGSITKLVSCRFLGNYATNTKQLVIGKQLEI